MNCFTSQNCNLLQKKVKVTLITFFTGIIFLCAFFMQSCEDKVFNPSAENGPITISENSDNEVFADMEFGESVFTFFTQTNNLKSSSNSGSALQSNFQIKKGNVVIYNTTYELDTTIRDYRLLQHKKIEQIAKSFKNNLTEDDYAFVAANIKKFIKEISKNKLFNSTSLQSLYFHKAIVNAKLREKQTGVVECVPYPFYITGKSFYSDIKDVSIPKKTVQSVLKAHPEIKNDKGVPELNAFISNFKGDIIPFEKIYFLNVDKQRYIQFLDNFPNKTCLNPNLKSVRTIKNKQGIQKSECDCSWLCPLGCGCDWGCCANYSGCCFYTHPICFLHDWECTCCDSEYVPCFDGCVPDEGCP